MSSGDKQDLFLSFTVDTLFHPRCSLGACGHTEAEKREAVGSVGTTSTGGNQPALMPSWHWASLAPPVGPFHSTNLPPIKTGTMLLAYRRNISDMEVF